MPELGEAAYQRQLQTVEVNVDPVDPAWFGGPADGNKREPERPEAFDTHVVEEHFEKDNPVRPAFIHQP